MTPSAVAMCPAAVVVPLVSGEPGFGRGAQVVVLKEQVGRRQVAGLAVEPRGAARLATAA